ncbi:MAG: ATP-dependent helicase HrpB, partial [Spirochaetes bacterium]|nr:ATP-dependent helicase HrpB [Spirochaetota bacterium]
EILEADLAPLALETAAWGAKTAEDLAWLTPPPQAHLRRAMALLADLGLVEGNGAISPQGRAASGLGLHPRLARMVLRAALEGDVATAALVAALIEEGGGIARGAADFRDRIEQWIAWSRSAPGDSSIALNRVRDEAARCARAAGSSFNAKDVDPSIAGRLLLLAYPDRAAKSSGVQGNRTRWTLAGGRAAFSSVPFSGCEYIVAPEIDGGDTDGRILLAAPVDEKDIIRAFKQSLEETVSVSWKGWKPVFEAEFRAGGMLIERGRSAVPEAGIIQREALRRLSELGLQSLPWSDESRALLARCRLARKKGMSSDFPDFSETALLDKAGTWLIPFGRWDGGTVWDDASILKALKSRLGYALAARLDSWAPEWVLLPSGSRRRVEYEIGEFPVIAARLQEFFGCADTPLIAGEPALLHLLSPAGRPVQVTRDLGGFWSGTYRDVRKELLGRYPRHYWPENPMEAEPTNRAKPRKK